MVGHNADADLAARQRPAIHPVQTDHIELGIDQRFRDRADRPFPVSVAGHRRRSVRKSNEFNRH
jgi:hypothetical protein